MDHDDQKPESLGKYALRRMIGGASESFGGILVWIAAGLLALGVLFFAYNKWVSPILSAPADALHSVSEGGKTGWCKVWITCEVIDGKRIPDSENPRIIAEKKAKADAKAAKAKAKADAKAAKAKAKADAKAAKEANGEGWKWPCLPVVCDKDEKEEMKVEDLEIESTTNLPDIDEESLISETSEETVKDFLTPLSKPSQPQLEVIKDPNEPELADGVLDGDLLNEDEKQRIIDDISGVDSEVGEESSGWRDFLPFGSDDESDSATESQIENTENAEGGITGIQVFKDVWRKRPKALGGESIEE